MVFCEKCGSPIEEGSTFCGECGAPAPKQGVPTSAPVAPVTTLAQSAAAPLVKTEKKRRYYGQPGPNGMPALAENEVVVRQYRCCEIKRPKASGDLTVTNKRLIFHADGTSSRVVKEVPISAVSGLDCFMGMNIRWGMLIFGILLILIGFLGFGFLLESGTRYGGGAIVGGIGGVPIMLALALGALLIFLAFRRSFLMCIYAQNTSCSSISLGSGTFSRGAGNGALYTLASEPAASTARMMVELGALVQDLQTMGDHAVEKWSE